MEIASLPERIVHAVWLALGLLLLVLVALDVLWTTLREGAGLWTRLTTRRAWRVALAIHRVVGSHRLLGHLGIWIVLGTMLTWIAGLWIGWSLVFCWHPDAVVRSDGGSSPDVWERSYFAATTLLSLGPGDFVPGSRGAKVATSLATLSGLFLITFSVTYLVPVVQAATHKRQVATFVTSLGRTPLGLLLRSWDGSSFRSLEDSLQDLVWELTMLEQRHLTYPVLHYLHSASCSHSMALSVSALDEALTVLQLACAEEVERDGARIAHTRASLQSLVGAIAPRGDPARAPEPPPLQPLRERGVPLVSDEVWEERLQAMAAHRSRLLAMVEMDGWRWSDVHRGHHAPPGERGAA